MMVKPLLLSPFFFLIGTLLLSPSVCVCVCVCVVFLPYSSALSTLPVTRVVTPFLAF